MATPVSYKETELTELRGEESVASSPASVGDTRESWPLKMHDAVQDRDMEKIEEIMGSDDVERFLLERNGDGEIPLHLACKLHDKDKQIMEQLLVCDKESQKKYAQLIEKQLIEKQLKAKVEKGFVANRLATNTCTVAPKPKERKNQPSPLGSTSLHIVAGGFCNKKMMKSLIKRCDELEILPELLQQTNKDGNTPVHIAAITGHISMLNEIEEKKKGDKLIRTTAIEQKGKEGRLPLHYASGYGRLDVVKKLVEWDETKQTIEATYEPPWQPKYAKKKEQTPLTKACYFGHHEVVKYLIEEGAEIHCYSLIAAIQEMHPECVKLLLSMNVPDKYLTFPYRPRPHLDSSVLTTAFHELIKHMPDMAEYVLNTKCVQIDFPSQDEKHMKVTLDYQYVDDDGQHWNKLEEGEKDGEPKLANESMELEEEEKEEENKPANELSNCKLEEGEKEEKKPADGLYAFNRKTHPLSLMVEYKRENLLTHPVVAALIHDKWNSVYGAFCFSFWLLYLMFFMIEANVLLQLLPHPNSDYCAQSSGTDDGLCSLNMDCKNATDHDQTNKSDVMRAINISLAVFMLFYSVSRILYELYYYISSIILHKRMNGKHSVEDEKEMEKADIFISLQKFIIIVKQLDFLWDLTNYLETLVLFPLASIFSIAVFIMNDNLCLSTWQWHIGAIILWLSWIEFLFLSIQFKLIGVYTLMFIKILKSLLNLLPSALLLVAAFGLTFHFLLYQPNYKASPFFTLGYSFLKAISMTVEDVSADDFFGLDIRGETRDTSHLQYIEFSTIFWILSLFLMTILLSNLMIGLAVGDIEEIYRQAKLEKLSLQVNLILIIENIFLNCKCLQKKCYNTKTKKNFMPNKLSPCSEFRETVRRELSFLLWGGTRYDSPESIQRLLAAKNEMHNYKNV